MGEMNEPIRNGLNPSQFEHICDFREQERRWFCYQMKSKQNSYQIKIFGAKKLGSPAQQF